MTIFQLTIAEQRRRTLARSETERRALVRDLISVADGRLLFFNLVDDHFHATARAPRPGLVASSLRRVIQARRRDLTIKRVWFDAVESRAHLMSLVRYQVLQADHHGLAGASLLDAGCCFQDLVGARILTGFSTQPLAEEAPRLRLHELFVQVGLEPVELQLASDDAIHAAGVARLADLAAEVFCVGPDLSQGRTVPVVMARALVARLARQVGFSTADVSRYLGVATRTVRDAAAYPLEPRAVVALRRRFSLAERDAQRARTLPRSGRSGGARPGEP